MENINLIETFSEFKELKNIDRATMISVLEDVFRSMLQKMYTTDENFDVIINIDKGDFEIWRNREVVEDGYNGLLIEPKNPRALAEAILYIFSNPVVQKKMGAHGRKKAIAEFDEKIVLSKTLEIYRGIKP